MTVNLISMREFLLHRPPAQYNIDEMPGLNDFPFYGAGAEALWLEVVWMVYAGWAGSEPAILFRNTGQEP